MSWFRDRAQTSLNKAGEILEQRGEEYADSWGDPVTTYIDAVLREIPSPVTKEEKRILSLASLCDVKLSRVRSGGFKQDSFYDHMNYEGAFVEAMTEYLEEKNSLTNYDADAPIDCYPTPYKFIFEGYVPIVKL